VLRLGMREVYRVVLEIVTCAALNAHDGFGLRRVNLWRHSLATAVAAQILARHLTAEDTEIVFTAALLHDIGKALLAKAAGAEYFRLLDYCEERNGISQCLEQEMFRTDHAEAAGRLLRRWKIPERIVTAVAGHHHPLKLPQGKALPSALIYAGNVLAYRLGHGNGLPRYVVEPDAAIVGLIRLEPHELYRYEDEVEEMLRREQDRFR
jgi:putative nucleotidyltransferase with HDIG domain